MELTAKQIEALQVLARPDINEVLFGGGAGGAKSFLGCYWLCKNCIKYPGSRWLMGRSVLKTLKETTLNTFFEVSRQLNLVSGHHYKYNEQKGQIKFLNDSVILLKDLFRYPSDPEFDDLGSLEITGAFIDECNQITDKAREIVLSRIRYKLDTFGLSPKMLMTCNPAKNWVYKEFYKPAREGTMSKDRAFIQALVVDNPFISRHYVESLGKLSKESKERLLFGNWEYDDDPAALIDFDAIQNLFSNKHIPAQGKRYLTCDIATRGSDRMVIMAWSGWQVTQVKIIDKNDGAGAAKAIADMKLKHGVPASHVVYDADGVGGGLTGIVAGQEFHNGGRPLLKDGKQENYDNLKTQCYYHLAEKMNNAEIYISAALPNDLCTELIEELEQVKRRDMDSDGKLKIVSKEQMKAALGRSPDLADCLMMRMFFELDRGRLPKMI